jgi:4'-phosphopantetheinyl transferase
VSYVEIGLRDVATPEPGLTLFTCPLDSDDVQPLDVATTVLSADEKARAARFHFDRDRKRFVRGRGFLRHVLGHRVGEAADQVVLATGPRGKPSLIAAAAPWFNLSHSGSLMVLALCETGPVGIDIELPTRKINSLQLGETCFLPTENTVLRRLSGESRSERFLTFWSAKEARMKLTGEGMALAPKSIELDLSGGWPVGYLQPNLPPARLIIHRIRRPEMTTAAICCIALQQEQV